MSKKTLKKEVKRLNKIIDVLLRENRGVEKPTPKRTLIDPENLSAATTSDDYIGGRPGDRG